MPRGTPNAKPAAAKLTATPLKTEFYNFAGTLPADTAYERLEPLLAEAGWFYRLVEIDAVPCYDGSMLMRYEVNIGRTTEAGGYEFEAVDAASMKMPGQPGPNTTVISPAGAGIESRLTKAWRSASSTADCEPTAASAASGASRTTKADRRRVSSMAAWDCRSAARQPPGLADSEHEE